MKVTAILTSQLMDVIVNTLSKAAMKKGINNFVFVIYSNAFAPSFLFLFTFIFSSVIGAGIVVIGFYAVLSGKTQEKVDEEPTVCGSEPHNNEATLLLK